MSRLSGVRKEFSWAPGSVTNGSEAVVSTTVAGAKIGDFCFATLVEDQQDLTLSAYITSANTARVVLINNTGSPVDLGTVTVHLKVVPWESL